MEIVDVKVSDVKAYEKNPRKIPPEAVSAVANSIKEFGFKVPVILDKDHVIVAGHTRVMAAKKLGMENVPCVLADDLTEKQIQAFRLADNKVGEIAAWDVELLMPELAQLEDFFDMNDFGFELQDVEAEDEERDEYGKYTMDYEAPQYKPSGKTPLIDDLVCRDKANDLINRIRASSVSDEEKSFLIAAAYRHNCFDYSKVADYYACASGEMQRLMEESALVIIDFDDAIKNGFAVLSRRIQEIRERSLSEKKEAACE